ncbi:hypothetical protein [Acinetobacter guillouiae]|uniref:hypothetical protein n=1 Tax=Acinetobacter guillouiae TaxID=106649 RepID=UPI0003A17D59|nr:hypothetical protein [Acinetobacter guillouiae]
MKFKRIIFICFISVSLSACSNATELGSKELKQSFESSSAYFSLDTPIYKVIDKKSKVKYLMLFMIQH